MPLQPQLLSLLHRWLRRRRIAKGVAAAALGVLVFAAGRLVRARRVKRVQVLPVALSAILSFLDEQRVKELIYTDRGHVLAHLKVDQVARPGVGLIYSAHLVPGCEEALFALAREARVVCRYMPTPWKPSQALSLVMPFAFLFVWYRLMRSMMSKDEKYVPSREGIKHRHRTTFADVVTRSKIELAEIVDYLNRPEKYRKAGARLPRGALLAGPSGTGKTLLARAVAGEARCAFISASASEFVEVYVGRGAARVRDLFQQARQLAPAVLFFDEIDALGSRTRNGLGSNEEYVQTLNQLLTELDGIHGSNDGLVVLAATNRYEAIDPSLLRPGRFDRHIFVELPNEEDRLQILTLHASNAAAAEHLEASALARAAADSTGFSGAELANVVNEAVFLALRAGRSQVVPEDLDEAMGRARYVRERAAMQKKGTDAAGLPPSFFRIWPAAAAR